MKLRTLLRMTPLLLAPIMVVSCGDETAPDEGHHPHSARLFVGAIDVTSNFSLATTTTVVVEVRFYNEAGDLITGIESDHFASLTFTPGALATVTDVVDNNFHKSVTAGAPGTGTVMVGYGHDAAADEESFGPFNVTVN